jgi:hypothetical protein
MAWKFNPFTGKLDYFEAGGSTNWGDITGTLSDQTDLQDALDAKQDTLVSATNIKTINGTSLLGEGDVAISGTISDAEKAISLQKPLGAYAFLNGSSQFADTTVMPSNFQVKGNFTVFKRFGANTSAYNAGFVDVQNDAGDRIQIYNQGYTFRIKVSDANTEVFSFSEASSSNFPSPGKIDCFIEVDFDLKQVRVSYDGYSNSHSVPELDDIKDSVFTYNRADLSAYRDGVKSWYMLTGLYNYESIDLIFGSADESALPQGRSKNNSIGKELITTQPTRAYIFGQYRNFASGEINVTATEVNSKEYVRLDSWVLNDTLANYGASALTLTFSLDVVSGSMSFYASGGCRNHFLFRAVEKDTGVVKEIRNISSTSAELETLPEGRWAITMQVAQSSAYGTVAYPIYAQNNEVDTEITIYQDFELYTAAVVLSALPQMADYDQIYCPFSKALLSGAWSLSPTY